MTKNYMKAKILFKFEDNDHCWEWDVCGRDQSKRSQTLQLWKEHPKGNFAIRGAEDLCWKSFPPDNTKIRWIFLTVMQGLGGEFSNGALQGLGE